MIRTRLCFVAEGVIRDGETNAISAFNLLEQIAAVSVPFFIQRISFFVLWERNADDHNRIDGQFTITLNDTNLITKEVSLDFSEGNETRTIINLGGLVVQSPGSLRFSIQLQDGASAEYAITIVVPPPTVEQATPTQH